MRKGVLKKDWSPVSKRKLFQKEAFGDWEDLQRNAVSCKKIDQWLFENHPSLDSAKLGKTPENGHLLGQVHGPIWSSRLGLADFQIPPANRIAIYGTFFTLSSKKRTSRAPCLVPTHNPTK